MGQDAARQGASLAARNFVFRVDGNPYGRRTAGSVYRDELEEVLTGKLSQEYDFQRGTKVFLDRQSGLILTSPPYRRHPCRRPQGRSAKVH